MAVLTKVGDWPSEAAGGQKQRLRGLSTQSIWPAGGLQRGRLPVDSLPPSGPAPSAGEELVFGLVVV